MSVHHRTTRAFRVPALPLRKDLRSLAVIGPLADDAKSTLGSWSGAGKPEDAVSVLAGLRSALTGRTSIIVSHRLAAVRDADWIVVLDAGRIVEQGVHTDLIARGGRYWELLRRQQLEEELEEESVSGV